MTNEEKAKEIAELHKIIYIANTGEHGSSYLECYSSAIQMAEWKEQQMIERVIEWIRYYNENGGCEFDNWEDIFRKEIKK